MKKFFYSIAGFILSLPLYAADALGLTLQDFRDQVFRPDNLPVNREGDASVETKANDLFQYAINLILYASGSVAVLILIIGAVRYIMSFGNQELQEGAKKNVKYALMGLVIVILAYAIVQNVIDLIYDVTVS